MDGLWWKTLLKWMIWGYHYFRKPPYTLNNQGSVSLLDMFSRFYGVIHHQPSACRYGHWHFLTHLGEAAKLLSPSDSWWFFAVWFRGYGEERQHHRTSTHLSPRKTSIPNGFPIIRRFPPLGNTVDQRPTLVSPDLFSTWRNQTQHHRHGPRRATHDATACVVGKAMMARRTSLEPPENWGPIWDPVILSHT